MLVWKEEYGIGVDLIDEQHKHLFEIGNRAYSILKDKLCIDKYDKVAEVLEDLRDYTKYHFKTEEDYMLDIGYSNYFAQKVAHKDFVDKLDSYDLNSIDELTNKEIEEILSFIFKWVLEHILKEDKKIVNS
ncbi:bacteriohemerythrin [Andreesenia angusta]|uniref:Bacteriohemerythrin n=1 Tax=Andreesenia angusta TaxID=39480 RepID=A0A1S1V9I7_9FIRM|nr:hemerythrin family protein [Andreesenia angusta]OHW63252.1 bacteriohemerythrin [Andreesenia angusta]